MKDCVEAMARCPGIRLLSAARIRSMETAPSLRPVLTTDVRPWFLRTSGQPLRFETFASLKARRGR